ESVARWAGTARAIEREELGRRRRRARGVVRTLEPSRELERRAAGGFVTSKEDEAVAVPLGEGRTHGVGNAPRGARVGHESIDDNEQGTRDGEVDGRRSMRCELIEVRGDAVGNDAEKSLLAQSRHD